LGEGQRDRRQHPRFTVAGKATGRVTAVHDASLVDISFGGVLIEHSQVVRPGTTSSLDLDLDREEAPPEVPRDPFGGEPDRAAAGWGAGVDLPHRVGISRPLRGDAAGDQRLHPVNHREWIRLGATIRRK
jgi:hypothetical protein